MKDTPSIKELERKIADLEQENAQARRALEQYRKAEEKHLAMTAPMGVRAGELAHDFNNILGIILGNTELALRELPQWDPARDWLAEIKTATMRAIAIVHRIPGLPGRTDESRVPADGDEGFEKNLLKKWASEKKGSERILFIDDEAAIVRLGKQMLEYYGYTVTVSVDPLKALEVFSEDPNRFDLVITDLIMPAMSGSILVEELINIRPGIPVIVCSGHADLIDSKITDQRGIKAFLAKPIRMIDLNRKIREVLDGSIASGS